MKFEFLTRLFVVMLVAVVVFPVASRAAEEKTATISVSGTGTVSVAPDMAIISVGVMRQAKTARQAVNENNSAMAAVIGAMKAEKIEDRDLQTSGFSIQPRYFYPKRKSNGEQEPPRITGYIVNNNLTIRVRDLDQAGTILDKVITLGVNTGGNIRFTNADTNEIMKQARQNAVQDAIEKAQTLTGAAGVALGKITAINEHSNAPRPINIGAARSLAVREDASAVPIASGENEYRVMVNISWELDQ
ncbi:MAG: SIMPL domain-containing protein [Pseudomonadota bacterium]